MKLAYIILAHHQPEQLCRLALRLNHPGSTIVIHLCKNMKNQEYRQAKDLLSEFPGLHFCKREDGSWGEFGIVQAVINGMKLLLDKKIDFDYLNVISGNDYPIKTNAFIHDFFEKQKGTEFFWQVPVYDFKPLDMPDGAIYGEGWSAKVHPWPFEHRFNRFEKYWFSLLGERLMIVPEERFIKKPLSTVLKIFIYGIPEYFRKKALKREFLLMILSLTHSDKRIFPEGYMPYLGSQWFSITKDCVEYIIKTHESRPSLKKYFKHTLLADESFFSTILAYSPFKAKIAQNNYRFIKWNYENRSHPVVLDKDDLAALKSSYKLFARKFDMRSDRGILDLIDKEILNMDQEKSCSSQPVSSDQS